MLIAFEGLHGCGKTTQINKIYNWITFNLQQPCVVTSWNSYGELKELGDKLKGKDLLDPLISSLLYGLDFNLRYKQVIVPALESNSIVLCDRYIYTAYVRDSLRNVSKQLLDGIYGQARKPDIVFFFKADPDTCVDRQKSKLRFRSSYILGLDLKLAPNKIDNFRKFLYMQDNLYAELIKKNKDNFYIIESSESIENQFNKILCIINEHIHRKNGES